MTNSDINAVIAFLLLLVPFGLLWLKAFRHFKNRLTTTLNKWVLTLISVICFDIYFYLAFWLGYLIDGLIGDSMGMASYAALVFSFFPLIIILVGTTILTIAHHVKKRRTLS